MLTSTYGTKVRTGLFSTRSLPIYIKVQSYYFYFQLFHNGKNIEAGYAKARDPLFLKAEGKTIQEACRKLAQMFDDYYAMEPIEVTHVPDRSLEPGDVVEFNYNLPGDLDLTPREITKVILNPAFPSEIQLHLKGFLKPVDSASFILRIE